MEELWNIPLHGAYICGCDWFNKEWDWPIAEQDKVRWKSQTENAGRKKGVVGGVTSRYREKQDGYALLRKDTKPHGTA